MRDFIITGAPRSGTTAMCQLLSCDPRIFCWNELGYYIWDEYPHHPLLDHVISAATPQTKVSLDRKGINLDDARMGMDGVTDLLNTIETAHEITGAEYIGDKHPSYVEHIERVHESAPTTPIIYMLRDGRDVLYSCIRAAMQGLDVPWASMLPAESRWMDAIVALKYLTKVGHPTVVVRYESLCLECWQNMIRVAKLLGFDYVIPKTHEFTPTHAYAWREEYPEIEDNLSEGFKTMLVDHGYKLRRQK